VDVLITEKCVYCSVRIEYLNVIGVTLSLQLVVVWLGRPKLIYVASIVMKMGQRPKTGE
jgi:hypothetical protein